MSNTDNDIGKLNPRSPSELARFAFLVGNWKCEAKLLVDGKWQTFRGEWNGRWILDGHAIADEYKMFGPDGTLLVLGVNIRAYDEERRQWNIKWLNGLSGTWLDLSPEELGGVSVQDRSISYVFKETIAGHAYTRATYIAQAMNHWTWRGDRSEDRKHWNEFMVIEANRLN